MKVSGTIIVSARRTRCWVKRSDWVGIQGTVLPLFIGLGMVSRLKTSGSGHWERYPYRDPYRDPRRLWKKPLSGFENVICPRSPTFQSII